MITKQAQLETILFLAGDSGILKKELTKLLELSQQECKTLIKDFANKLKFDDNSGLNLVKINDIVKLTTKPECSEIASKYFDDDLNKTLSQPALEILAIIAYRQPITRIEIDQIRGVNSSGALQTLIWRGLVEINGKKDVAGHPNIYVTTNYFLQYFGYQTLADLPTIEKFYDNVDEDGQIDLFESKGLADNKILNGNNNIEL